MLSFRFVSTWADIFRLERRNSSNVPIIKEGAKQVQSKLRLSAIVSFSRCSNSPSVQTVVGLPKSFHITHFSCNGKYLISLNSCLFSHLTRWSYYAQLCITSSLCSFISCPVSDLSPSPPPPPGTMCSWQTQWTPVLLCLCWVVNKNERNPSVLN